MISTIRYKQINVKITFKKMGYLFSQLKTNQHFRSLLIICVKFASSIKNQINHVKTIFHSLLGSRQKPT
jgi:hypothetical protein